MQRRQFVAIVAGLTIVAVAGYAQDSPRWAQKFKLTDHLLSLSPSGLSIDLENLAEGTDWAVGTKVASGDEATAQIGLVHFTTESDGALSVGGMDLPASSLVISPGSVLLKDLSKYAGDRLFVYVKLPRQTVVQIEVNGANIVKAQPSPGFMVHDGNMLSGVPQSGLSVLNLIVGAPLPSIHSKSIGSAPEVTKLGNGVFVANNQSLAAHVIESRVLDVRTSKKSGAEMGHHPEVVSAYLSINEQGRVTSVRCEGTDTAAVAQCRKVAEDLHFKPFLVDGRAVPVRGQWPFLFDGTNLISLISLQKRNN